MGFDKARKSDERHWKNMTMVFEVIALFALQIKIGKNSSVMSNMH